MKSSRFIATTARVFCSFVLVVCAQSSRAGFLEMPDTTEVPEMERESMLKDLDIPSVRERDPDPNAGPRLNITEFRVQGVVEYPELGITRESLNKLVEGIRFELMGEGEMLDSGYTLDEMSEISDLVAQIEEETKEQHVGPMEVQRLVFLIREQRRRRGVTVGMIESVGDTITRYYRERGFILAKAYIPEQRVRDGVVTLTLLLGNLGEVAVLNNRKYGAKTLNNIFEPVIGQPVTAKNIEERLYFVNDMPGLSAQAYFEAGSQVGDTRLNINVVEEKSFAGNVRLDNHGSSSTGEYRLYTDGYWNNPSGFGDQLHIGILGAFDPTNSLYGSLHYGLPLFSPRAKFTFGGSTNDFVSDSLTGVTLTGTSVVYDATLNYILTRSRVKNYATELRYSDVKSDIEEKAGLLPLEPDELDDRVRNLDLVLNFDVLLEKWRAMHQGGLRFTYGDFVKGRGVFQDENPLSLSLNYSYIQFVRVPFTESNSRVQLKFAGQYADTSLPSTSQFSLTGPTKMRAFSINQYNADVGAYLAAEWIFNGPKFLDFKVGGESFSNIAQPYVFFEAGYGDTYDSGQIATKPNAGGSIELPGTWAMLSDVGLGLRFTYRSHFRANISYAHATSYESDLGPLTVENLQDLEDRGKFYFDMQYGF
jgi:hemolysin activation/secretion protein